MALTASVHQFGKMRRGMMDFGLFNLEGLTPHGFCLSWRPELFWSMAVSDAVIAVSYLSISLAIAVYVVKRKDMYLRWVAVAFALFILLCGSSHASDLWTLWLPEYGVQVIVKGATALVSVITAVLLWPLIPRALSIPSAAQLAMANNLLRDEVEARRAAESSLRATEKELRAANTELESFAYAVSHDLRAPLRAMTGFSAALVEDFGDQLNEEARGYLNEILRGGRHMGELIDGLLQLSRITREPLRREPVDVSAVAMTVRDELIKAHPDRAVAWDIEPGLEVWCDRRLIEVVLRNLLENAVKYSAGVAAPAIGVSGGSVDGCPAVCVSDNGAGFDMAHADKLFKPFQRLHRQDEFPGIGIGLSTVSRIVQRHGGVILAESTVGGGAIFRFSLPQPESHASMEVEHDDIDNSTGRGQQPGRSPYPAGAA